MTSATELTPGGFARFYAPLVATSMLLTATNPILAAALGRAVDPASALAGFAVAFALSGVLYSPLLVVQQVAATRMLAGGDAGAVRRFALVTGLLLSGVAAAVAFTPLGGPVLGGVIGVTGRVYEQALDAMTLLWPLPLLTGLRALHQGRLVAAHDTHPIALATGLRTGVLALVAFALTLISAGAWAGAAAFTLGLVVEVVVVGWAPADPRSSEGAGEGVHEPVLRFSTPLIVNVLLWWSTPLIINAFLARTPEPDCALAAFAVVEALAWFVTSPVGQLQHASIALVESEEGHRRVRLWGLVLAGAVFAVLAVLALPAVREPLLRWAFELDSSLLDPTARALPVAALYPLLYAHRQYYQGLFIKAGRPGVVGWGAVLRVGSLTTLAAVFMGRVGHDGALLGVAVAAFGLVVEGVFLERMSHGRALPELGSPAVSPPDAVSAS